jgi:hypothetical protein
MSLTAKDSGGGSFTPVAPGMHLARCYRIVDMGTQKSEYQGQVKHLQKVMIQFEVHGEDDNGNGRYYDFRCCRLSILRRSRLGEQPAWNL